ncbi:MAG TPA: hypothetical protein VJN62_01875 [Gemmatimonadales bacterium]|nr:hypothetical protein [Gemmatimonadales bacterium]
MRIGRPTLLALGLVAAMMACTEDATAPGKCPTFCPGGQLKVVDTILNVISRDSSYVGYVQPDSAQEMLAANALGLDSRPIFLLGPVGTRVLLKPDSTGDTTTVPYLSVDSATLVLQIDRRDTLASNLTISLYRLPKNIGPSTTLADLAGPFTDSLVRSVNVDSVLHLAGGIDSTTGDSVAVVDSATGALKVKISLDSVQANFLSSDSGSRAYGLRISADSLAIVSFASVRGSGGPTFRWWGTFDSLGTKVGRVLGISSSLFNSFVSNVGTPALDSNLVVGGVPSARSLLRFSIPRGIRDSAQVIRATLYLVPVTAPAGLPGDSIIFALTRVSTDLGAKSPCIPDPFDPVSTSCVPPGPGDSAFVVEASAHVGRADTIATDITLIVRGWAADTVAPQALMLRGTPEGGSLVPLRLFSSRTTAFRPSLHITYVPRFSFGSP